MDNYKDTSTKYNSNTVICEIIKWTVMALLDKSMFYNIHSLISDYTKYSSWEDYNCVFSSQVKSSLLYCQFFHMYSTYIQRIEIALLSDLGAYS